MGRAGVLALIVAVIAAGCAAPAAPGGPDEPTAEDGANDGSAEDPATSNPWGQPTLTVSIVHETGSWRNVTALVADTLQYWERRDDAYGNYEVGYDLKPNAADPDVVIRYVEDVSVCGSVGSAEVGGFAPRITAANPPEPPEYVCVRAGYTEAGTRHVLKHEFGHLLGLGHSDRPRAVMEPRRNYQRIPRPTPAVVNASFRSPLRVAVDRSTIYARRHQIAGQQLDSVFAYYERGADGSVDEATEIVEVDDEDEADVVVTFPRQSPCPVETGSCGSLGRRSNGQPQLEVAITTTHEDTFGWHAAVWLAVAAGVDHHADLPAALRNATFSDRRSPWWRDGARTISWDPIGPGNRPD